MLFCALVFGHKSVQFVLFTNMKKPAYITFLLAAIPLIFLSFSIRVTAQTVTCFDTNIGSFCVELLETEAPGTSQNFLGYLNQGSYRNSFFHLLSTESPAYIQGGRFADLGGGDLSSLVEIFRRPSVTPETSVPNTRGTLAMVPDDLANPDVITSQFIINLTDNPQFDDTGDTTVFARILGDGLDIVDAIATLPAISLGAEGLEQVPVIGPEVPAINSVRVNILDAYIYDGTAEEYLAEFGGSGGNGGEDGDDNGGETPTPGEGEVLYKDAVCVDTNVGEFCMQMLTDVTPITVQNFLNYINSGRYDDTFIHRSVPGFVIQGGGYRANPLGASIERDDAIQNEFNRSNLRGTVAMARLGGIENSATSEWYVNLANNSQLDNVDGGFTVFGEIVSGMDVIDSIANLPISDQQSTLGSPFGELPLVDEDDDGVDADDIVLVQRIYITDVIANEMADSGATDNNNETTPETTAQYSSLTQSFKLDVKVNSELYRVTMFRREDLAGLSFSVNTSTIITVNDVGQDRGIMDLDSGIFTVPTILVGGQVVTDVVLKLTDFATLTFRLESYNTQ